MMTTPNEDPRDDLLNPHRREEQDAARAAGAARLQQLGVHLSGTESSEDVADLLDAIERFEQAVESRGGDLMVDEAPRGHAAQPDDPSFVLPSRTADESVSRYLERLVEAAARIRHAGRRSQ
jgi:hypothetical protein